MHASTLCSNSKLTNILSGCAAVFGCVRHSLCNAKKASAKKASNARAEYSIPVPKSLSTPWLCNVGYRRSIVGSCHFRFEARLISRFRRSSFSRFSWFSSANSAASSSLACLNAFCSS